MSQDLRARYEAEEQLRIHGEIGRGGFGRVYHAHHLRLDAQVAVKVLTETLQATPSALKLFAREARVMARIDHPNVLRVFDYADGPEGPYIVTEWMAGGTIERAADEARLRAVASAAASALQALHEAGVIHRDVKPPNLLVREDGRIKLGDLGVALAGEDAADRAQVIGTIPYMAPELFDDVPAYRPASDVHALGVSLYQLWTGRLPYEADSAVALIAMIRDASPPGLSTMRGGLTASVARLIAAMMARDPAGRPSTADIVRELTRTIVPAAASSNPEVSLGATVAAVGTPMPTGAVHELPRIGPWVCTQETYRGRVWNTFFAHHRDTGRQARLGRLLSDWLLPTPVMVAAADRSARWSHDALVSVVDWGVWRDCPFFVTGGIGSRLLDIVQVRGAVGELEALELVAQLGDALAYLHARGFVFQMVDPTAIGSRTSGAGWMLDWPAYAMPIGAQASPHYRYISEYSAPESTTAPTFFAATDVYGLGSTMSFMLTGSRAWLARVMAGELPDGLAGSATAATRSLMFDLAAVEPSRRPTAADARDRATAILRQLAPVT